MKLINGRPSIFRVTPLAARICFVFGIINILLGLSLFHYSKVGPVPGFVTVQGPLTFLFWAWAFVLLGGIGIILLFLNWWEAIRFTLIIGLFIKLLWAIGLVYRLFMGGSPFLTILWLMLATIQGLTYVYFWTPLAARREGDKWVF
jgi:hypothetical protein